MVVKKRFLGEEKMLDEYFPEEGRIERGSSMASRFYGAAKGTLGKAKGVGGAVASTAGKAAGEITGRAAKRAETFYETKIEEPVKYGMYRAGEVSGVLSESEKGKLGEMKGERIRGTKEREVEQREKVKLEAELEHGSLQNAFRAEYNAILRLIRSGVGTSADRSILRELYVQATSFGVDADLLDDIRKFREEIEKASRGPGAVGRTFKGAGKVGSAVVGGFAGAGRRTIESSSSVAGVRRPIESGVGYRSPGVGGVVKPISYPFGPMHPSLLNVRPSYEEENI